MGSEPLACLTEYPALSAQPVKPWAVVSCIHMSVVSLPSPLRYASLVAKVAVGASLLVLFSAPGPPDSRWADHGDGHPIARAAAVGQGARALSGLGCPGLHVLLALRHQAPWPPALRTFPEEK